MNRTSWPWSQTFIDEVCLPTYLDQDMFGIKKKKNKLLEETLSLKVIAYFPLLTIRLRLACSFHCSNLFIFLLYVKSLSFSVKALGSFSDLRVK